MNPSSAATPTLPPMTLPSAVRTGSPWASPFDRSGVGTGIVHIGVGGFHRSHQAVYVDDLLGRGQHRQWGICGVGLLPGDRRMRDVLHKQDCLYTLLSPQADGSVTPRIIGSIANYLFAPECPSTVLAKLASAQTRVVTLTITPGGYNLEPATGRFLDDDPVIRAEAAGEGTPRTHFRFLLEALRLRRDHNIAPFTIASCDNMQGNGDVARRTMLEYARLADPHLGDWIAEHVSFPNSMVDRITPVTTDQDRNLLREQFALQDDWPVRCEPFRQWVLEDAFTLGRPPLEEVGVQFVSDVRPYEMMKLRMLNGSHNMIGYVSLLRGHEFVHTAMADPLIREFIGQFMQYEAQPTLPELEGVDLDDYRVKLLDRFANPQISDTIARQCTQTSTSLPTFLLPTVRDQLAAGRPVDMAMITIAAWAYAVAHSDEYAIVDHRRDELVTRARDSTNPCAFIEDPTIFGDLAGLEAFREAFRQAQESLRTDGVEVTMRRALNRRSGTQEP